MKKLALKKLVLLIGVLALAQPVSAQSRLRMDATGRAQSQSQSRRDTPTQTEREALRAQVFQRFMARAADRLALDAPQRAKLEQVLRQNEERRRDLSRDSKQVRQNIQSALEKNASDAELSHMLDRLADIRVRDLNNWRAEQAELSRVLTPRQRAQFIGLRAELFDRVQQMRAKEREQRSTTGPEAAPPAQ